MNKQSMWSLRFSTASLVLIPVAVGINYIGKFVAGILKLPLWLDSIGTVLAAMLGGPIVGALAGAINNIIYGFTDPISFVYAITSVAIGVAAGVLFYKGYISSWGKAVVAGIIIGLVATVISTPLNIGFWGGQTGNVWGDALFAFVLANTESTWLASLLDEIFVDVPDKLLVVLVSYGIFQGLPRNVVQLYNNNDKVETLD
ncbi:ECF transporter S component [Neobacillus mesonae]|uniref:ECF transporter S component n=1 Tax=Neobacillus mesonae TaxID=1193713 RepID=A0A3T0HUP3_9BACI|nr:ECF transporter S component [Neobacillus mesonae]AZU60737.1 ECF transporter S component [Neobacillus mesonae]